jgi:hypothetical protein
MALLRAFATSHGRTWKSVLRQQWMAAGALPLLHALRNTHGPSWLISFRLPKDEDHLLANVNKMAATAEPANKMAAKAEPATKPVTPQVEALPGMTPLGFKPQHQPRTFTPISCTVATAIPYHISYAARNDLCARIQRDLCADKVLHKTTSEGECLAYITLPETFFDPSNARAIGDIIDRAITQWVGAQPRG